MTPYVWYRFLAAVSRGRQLRDRVAARPCRACRQRNRATVCRCDGPCGQDVCQGHKRPLAERIPLGDYVPAKWVAAYWREHPRNCGCRSCYERNLRSGGLP